MSGHLYLLERVRLIYTSKVLKTTQEILHRIDYIIYKTSGKPYRVLTSYYTSRPYREASLGY